MIKPVNTLTSCIKQEWPMGWHLHMHKQNKIAEKGEGILVLLEEKTCGGKNSLWNNSASMCN